jgi:hypothetical protein
MFAPTIKSPREYPNDILGTRAVLSGKDGKLPKLDRMKISKWIK